MRPELTVRAAASMLLAGVCGSYKEAAAPAMLEMLHEVIKAGPLVALAAPAAGGAPDLQPLLLKDAVYYAVGTAFLHIKGARAACPRSARRPALTACNACGASADALAANQFDVSGW